MKRALQSLIFTIAVLPAVTLAAPPSDLPIAYTLKFPFLGDGNSRVLDFHQTSGLSVAAVRKADEPGLHARAAEGEIEWHDIWAYYTGPRTQGRIAVYENDHANMLDNPEYRFLVEQPLEAFEPGKPYGLRQWQAGELEIDFRRGDKDATIAGLDAEHYVATLAFDHDSMQAMKRRRSISSSSVISGSPRRCPTPDSRHGTSASICFSMPLTSAWNTRPGGSTMPCSPGWSRGCAKPACWSKRGSSVATRSSSRKSRTCAARPRWTRSRSPRPPCCAPGTNTCPCWSPCSASGT